MSIEFCFHRYIHLRLSAFAPNPYPLPFLNFESLQFSYSHIFQFPIPFPPFTTLRHVLHWHSNRFSPRIHLTPSRLLFSSYAYNRQVIERQDKRL